MRELTEIMPCILLRKSIKYRLYYTAIHMFRYSRYYMKKNELHEIYTFSSYGELMRNSGRLISEKVWLIVLSCASY